MRALLLSLSVLALSACTTAIPAVRDADMALSGAVGGHLYPPAEFPREVDLDNVVVKHVSPGSVGPECALYGDWRDGLVAECVKSFEDGSILVLLPDPEKCSRYYYETAKRHALGHVWQARNGMVMDHKGWGRFS